MCYGFLCSLWAVRELKEQGAVACAILEHVENLLSAKSAGTAIQFPRMGDLRARGKLAQR